MTETLWRLTGSDTTVVTDPNDATLACGLVYLMFQSAGKDYCVSVTGPTNMSVRDVANAFRAAAAKVLQAAGADISELNARPATAEESAKPEGTIQ